MESGWIRSSRVDQELACKLEAIKTQSYRLQGARSRSGAIGSVRPSSQPRGPRMVTLAESDSWARHAPVGLRQIACPALAAERSKRDEQAQGGAAVPMSVLATQQARFNCEGMPPRAEPKPTSAPFRGEISKATQPRHRSRQQGELDPAIQLVSQTRRNTHPQAGRRRLRSCPRRLRG